MSKPEWFRTEAEARDQARGWSLVVGRPIYVIESETRDLDSGRYAAHDEGWVRDYERVVGLYQRGAPGLKAKEKRK
jgi:hypothetical protein